VRGCAGAAAGGVSRATMAVFLQPEHGCVMSPPPGADAAAVLRGARGELLPPGVPPLLSRWAPETDDFGTFTARTLAAYH